LYLLLMCHDPARVAYYRVAAAKARNSNTYSNRQSQYAKQALSITAQLFYPIG